MGAIALHRAPRRKSGLRLLARGNPAAGESLFPGQGRRCAASPARRSAPGIRAGRAAVPRKRPALTLP
jgi:hypothetical protein